MQLNIFSYKKTHSQKNTCNSLNKHVFLNNTHYKKGGQALGHGISDIGTSKNYIGQSLARCEYLINSTVSIIYWLMMSFL